MTDTIISAGQIICLTLGEYSSFYVSGHYISCNEFDLTEEIKKYSLQYECDDYEMCVYSECFVRWLVERGFISSTPVRRIHLGNDYYDLDM